MINRRENTIHRTRGQHRTQPPKRRQRSLRCEALEPRHLLAANPIISEFMASNSSTIDDGFGNDSDWIEIYNAGDEAIDLQGHYLTDSQNDLAKWTFPSSTILPANEFLIVFASGENIVDPEGYHHTDFRLSAGGEYVAIVSPDQTVLSQFGADGTNYPPQFNDLSFGFAGGSLLSGETVVDYWIPTHGGLGTNWTSIGFDATANGFQSGQAAIGYEGSPNSATPYTNLINTFVPTGTESIYLRHEFELADASAVTTLNLNLQYDDGVVIYLNGQRVDADREPATVLWSSTSMGTHNDVDAIAGVDFPLSAFLPLLQDGPNVLAIHALNESSGSSDFLIVPTLTTDGLGSESGYLTTPTPGTTNSSLFPQGPLMLNVAASPQIPVVGQPIVVTAEISPYLEPIVDASVQLTYRRMFNTEVNVTMRDDGLGGDVTANNGIYTATIPSSAFTAGEMIRWYVSADDTEGTPSRAPRFLDPTDSAEYFGAVVPDPTASTDVPVIHWFVQDPNAAKTRVGTRASLQYRGEFYDNIGVDLHGQSTAGAEFIKKSYDFDANSGEKFDIADDIGRASDFNLLTNYADQTKIRHPLAYDVFRDAGVPSTLAYTVSVHQNGEFFGLYDFIEEGDEEQLRRLGLDENNNLYKVNNRLTSVVTNVEQKAGSDTSRSDLQEVIDGAELTGTAATNWFWDHMDMADFANYIAVNNLLRNHDFGHKNMYWYNDNSGTELWSVLPWDSDLTFGHNWTQNVTPPYFDNTLYTTQISGGFNDLFQHIFDNSEFRAMRDRRLRTLMDQFMGEPGTAISESYLGQEFIAREAVLRDEILADTAEWGIQANYSAAYPFTPAQAVEQQLNDWLPDRRAYLEGLSSIPNAHGDSSNVRIGTIEFNPATGNPDQQYIVIENNENFAVDISGWTIGGAVTHTFRPGTVIRANDDLHLAADVQGFLNRTTTPRGGQQRFVQGSQSGSMSQVGGVLDLANASGEEMDSDAYGITGDFDGDGFYTVIDIDILNQVAAANANLTTHDLTGDGLVDRDDVDAWLNQAGYVNLGAGQSYSRGDANLDGMVDDTDFASWTGNRFTAASRWTQADFNSDGFVDVTDFNAWSQNKSPENLAAGIASQHGPSLSADALESVALEGEQPSDGEQHNATSAVRRVPRAAPPAQVVDAAMAIAYSASSSSGDLLVWKAEAAIQRKTPANGAQPEDTEENNNIDVVESESTSNTSESVPYVKPPWQPTSETRERRTVKRLTTEFDHPDAANESLLGVDIVYTPRKRWARLFPKASRG